jgi:metal-dependent amidase/aminoacylase/carboxypeptidase family protein
VGNPNSIFAQYLGIGKIEIENKNADSIVIKAHLAGSSEDMCQKALKEIKVGISNSSWKDNLRSISFSFEHFTVYNDPILTQKTVNIVTSNFGEENILPLYGVNPYNNDDFAYFQEKFPGVYFLFGASNIEKGIFSFPHFPNFNVDKYCIEKGIKIFSTLLFEYLRNETTN